MRRLYAVLVAAAFLIARVPGVADAASPVADLATTYWNATQDPGGPWRIAFMPNGVFQYEDAAVDRYLDNGTWRISGGVLHIQLNNNYVQLTGTFQGDGSLVGQGVSKGGWKFKWRAVRAGQPHKWTRE